MAQTFLPVLECVGNTAIPVGPGCYVVTAVTADGETPFCDAICIGHAQSSIPPLLPPDPNLQCVNYFLVNRDFARCDFTWDPYPGATGYNVYTSTLTDPTNFVLSRVNIPVSTLEIADENVVVTAITLGGETPRCDAITYSANCPEVAEWLGRIATNGGVIPPIEEQFAVCDFIASLKAYNLWDRIIALNYFSPNGSITGLTWLKQGPFSDTWNWNIAPVGQTFTNAGFDMKGRYARTGVLPTDIFGPASCGITCYTSETVDVGKGQDAIAGSLCGARHSGGLTVGALSLHPFYTTTLGGGGVDPAFGFLWGDCWKWGSPVAYYPGTPLQYKIPAGMFANKGRGYVSQNRWNAFDKITYYAASNFQHTPIIADSHSNTGGPPDQELWIFSDPMQFTQFRGVCSMLAFHAGWLQQESESFYLCIQNFRMALGGGYV